MSDALFGRGLYVYVGTLAAFTEPTKTLPGQRRIITDGAGTIVNVDLTDGAGNWETIQTGGATVVSLGGSSSGGVLIGGSGGTAGTDIASYPATIGTHTDTTAGTVYNFASGRVTVQASSDASHTGTTTIAIEVSNDNVLWLVLGTISVTGNSASDGFASDAPWAYIRSNPSAHGDSTNVVTVTLGV